MIKLFAHDERGAVTIDWVTLSAGILLMGIMVVYSVMGNSAGYLMEEFDALNGEIETLGDIVSTSQQQTNINK
jgi:hypothetical protein